MKNKLAIKNKFYTVNFKKLTNRNLVNSECARLLTEMIEMIHILSQCSFKKENMRTASSYTGTFSKNNVNGSSNDNSVNSQLKFI